MQAALQPPRTQLIACATRLFAERGYHAVSLRQLGKAVGLQAGSLYAHFPSKEALLQELVEEGFERLLDGAGRRLKSTPSDERLQAFLDHHLQFQARNRHWCILAQVEARHLPEPARSALNEYAQRYRQLLEAALARQLARPCSSLRLRQVAEQALRLLDASPTNDTPLQDCLEDIQQLLLRRLLSDRSMLVAAPREATSHTA